jgi:hypothetical protein
MKPLPRRRRRSTRKRWVRINKLFENHANIPKKMMKTPTSAVSNTAIESDASKTSMAPQQDHDVDDHFENPDSVQTESVTCPPRIPLDKRVRFNLSATFQVRPKHTPSSDFSSPHYTCPELNALRSKSCLKSRKTNSAPCSTQGKDYAQDLDLVDHDELPHPVDLVEDHDLPVVLGRATPDSAAETLQREGCLRGLFFLTTAYQDVLFSQKKTFAGLFKTKIRMPTSMAHSSPKNIVHLHSMNPAWLQVDPCVISIRATQHVRPKPQP